MLQKTSYKADQELAYILHFQNNTVAIRKIEHDFITSDRIKKTFRMNQHQFLNLLAIEFLDFLGNKNPSQAEIDDAEAFISKKITKLSLRV